MSKLPKHLDLIALGGLTALLLGGAMLFDQTGLIARDAPNQAPALDGANSLYQGRPVESPATASQETPKAAAPKWLTNEDANPRDLRRATPAPYQQGEVQLGQGASLGGRRPFPDDNPWNQPVDQEPVDPLSDLLIERIGADKHCHPDFGAGYWNGAQIGIPYVVVSDDQELRSIKYTAYGEESDPGPFPIPGNAPIEGDPNVDGDRHVIVLDRDSWKLYELFRAFPIADGQLWRAECGAVFDMATNDLRPEGWTSADAAGLPIFPGLVRYEEAVEQQEIRHALRFTVSETRRAYLPPARHWASRSKDPLLPPLGMRVRLKKDFDISGFPPEIQVILRCLKTYGMFLADNGSDWYISGAPDPRWNDEALHTLKRIKGKDFEVVMMKGIVADE